MQPERHPRCQTRDFDKEVGLVISRMASRGLLAVLCFSAIATVAAASAPVSGPLPTCDTGRAPLRVLFVGNSFTYVGNVPRLVEAIAEGLPGPCVRAEMIAVGGATLEDHWKADSVAAEIREGRWSHVVLNDQSTFGEGWWLEGQPRVGTSGRELRHYLGRFAQVIRAAGADPVLIAHWSNIAASPRDRQALAHLFSTAAAGTGSTLAWPADAIERLRTVFPESSPYAPDGHHLSPLGAYAVALTLYSTLTGRPATGAPHRITGPAVEFDRGIVFPDSTVVLVDLPRDQAVIVQRLTEVSREAAGRRGVVPAPAPLSDEFPVVPSGDAVEQGDLSGTWSGVTLALPNPAGDSVGVTIELQRDAAGGLTGHVRLVHQLMQLEGPATVQVRGERIFLRGELLPRDFRGRGTPEPLQAELEAVLRDGLMIGVATITQQYAGSMGSFNAIGRFEARRAPESGRPRGD